jgi:hypothetical protein
MANDLDVLFEVVDRHSQLAGNLRDLMVLQEPQVLVDDFLRRRSLQADMPELKQQALLKVAGGNAGWIEALNQPERPFDVLDRPWTHGRQLLK